MSSEVTIKIAPTTPNHKHMSVSERGNIVFSSLAIFTFCMAEKHYLTRVEVEFQLLTAENERPELYMTLRYMSLAIVSAV